MRLTQFMNDKWLLIIGIPLIAILIPLLFTGFNFEFLLNDGFRRVILSMATTVGIWLGVRQIVIFLWKKYPWEKNPWKHLIYEIIFVTLYTSIIGYLSYMVYAYTDFTSFDEEFEILPSAAITFLITYLITCIHEAWFFYTQWNISLVKAQALQKENIHSQYETLKSQINPHFLFNTLNTLTTLIEENTETAVKYVDMTSDFLRRLLNMKDKEVITLNEEKEIVETFLHLQKYRFGENLTVSISIPEESQKMKLPPLSLQMLLENAIKHNVITSDKPLAIQIEVSDDKNVVVKNNLQKKNQTTVSSGIGLQNIRNRYAFLSDKKVKVIETTDTFEVHLPLLNDEEI